jgi:uncharacterized protein DUF4383
MRPQNVAAERPVAADYEWSPARIYLVASGIVLLILGVAGLALNRSFPTSPGAVGPAGSGWLFGVFQTNGWHSVAALGSGAVALAFATRAEWARLGAMVKGLFYVGVTTSLFITSPSTFLLVSNAGDQVVHASLAIGGIATAMATRTGAKER